MKLVAITFLIVSIALISKAQNSKEYNDLAWELRKEFPDSSIHYANQAYETAIKEGNFIEQGKALNFTGLAYNYKGDYAKSLEFHLLAKDVSINGNDSLQYAHAINSIGRLHHSKGNYIKAYEMYLSALDVFNKTNDKPGIAYCYNSLAELYIVQNNLKKAEEMTRNAIAIRSSIDDVMGQISAIIELAKIQKMNQEYIESYESYLEAENLASKNNAIIELAEIKLGISNLYFNQKNVDRGLVYALDALNIVAQTKNTILASKIQLTLGKLYFLDNDYSKSESELKKVLTAVEKSSDLELKTDAFYYMSLIKESQGKVIQALELTKSYYKAKQALDNSKNARIIERLEGKSELEKVEQENEILRAKQISNLALIDRQFILNIAITVGFILISMLFVFMYLSSSRKKRDNEKLAEKNEEIAAQNESLAELNDEKDTMMNIVAHDLQSPINNIKSLISMIESEGELNDIQKNFAQKIDGLSNAGKELIQDLLYVNDFEGSTHKLELLPVKIDELIEEISETYTAQAKSKRINLNLNLNGADQKTKTDKSYLLRILDNLISNAIKFTHIGKNVSISTYKDDAGIFKLKIKDEGQGFSEKDQLHAFKKFKKLSARPTAGESSNGLGLAIVKTLCGRLDIDIKLQSEIGNGSEFTLTFNH